MRTFAIGDIHGCYHTLLDLINKLHLEPQDRLIFLGDYIDRGPFSKQVVEYVRSITGPGSKHIALVGNHEKMCVDAYRGSGYWGQSWMNNGGAQTIDSYDTRTEEQKRKPSMALEIEAYHIWRENLPRVPDDVLDWFASLPMTYETDEFFFVHAGIDPEESLESQDEQDLLWIRGDFINYAMPLPKRVVFGHTPFEKPQILSNKIGIDTACVFGNKLTALCLDTMTTFQANHNDKDDPIWGG